MQRQTTNWAVALTATLAAPTMAGPPLAIDDPGILDPGDWELIFATSLENRPSGDSRTLFAIDASVGIGNQMQLSAVLPWDEVEEPGIPSESGVGNAEIGFKIGFFTSEYLDLAFAPLYAFDISDSSVRKGVADPVNVLTLPLEAEYRWDTWRLNAELAYNVTASGPNDWGYGAAMIRPLNDRVEIMFEVFGGASQSFSEDDLAAHMGFDFAITDKFHILTSIGTGLGNSDQDKMDVDFYLGVQWFP